MMRHDPSEKCAEAGRKALYEKPSLRTIELVAEETLGYGCKIFPGNPMGKSGASCGNALCALDLGS